MDYIERFLRHTENSIDSSFNWTFLAGIILLGLYVLRRLFKSSGIREAIGKLISIVWVLLGISFLLLVIGYMSEHFEWTDDEGCSGIRSRTIFGETTEIMSSTVFHVTWTDEAGVKRHKILSSGVYDVDISSGSAEAYHADCSREEVEDLLDVEQTNDDAFKRTGDYEE